MKHLLDKQCFGDYDFINLRIDFKTYSVEGYVDINAMNPEALWNVPKAWLRRN